MSSWPLPVRRLGNAGDSLSPNPLKIMFLPRILSVALLFTFASIAAETSSPASDLQFGGQIVYALEVPDSAAAAKWYERALGCEMVLDLSEMGWCEVSSPVAGAAIGLGEPESDEAPRSNGGSSIVFEVEDIEAARALLVERKVKVGEITVIPETVKLLELNDPWGNRLMLSESMQP